MDGSNYTMFGEAYVMREIEYEEMLARNGIYVREAPIPKYGGNPKNKRKDLVQLNIQTVTDSDGVLMYSRSYSGNVSDVEMDRDTLSYLIKKDDVKGSVIIADSKCCT
jgi:transposase